MKKYIGEFSDYQNQYTYKVEFKCSSVTGPDENIYLNDSQPVVIKTNSEDLFTPIKTQSATIQIVAKNYLWDLYNVDFSVECNIYRKSFGSADSSYVAIFKGYVTPNIYTQDYNNVSVISVECVSYLGKLKYIDYVNLDSNGAGIYDVGYLIFNLLNQPDYYYYISSKDIGIDGQIYTNGLKKIFLDEHNFYEDNEEHTAWKCYDILEEICKILGVSLVENDCLYYFIKYEEGITTLYKQTNYLPNGTTQTTVTQTINELFNSNYDINLFNSSNNSISLEDTYRMIEVKANTYPYEDAINKLLSSDNWELCSDVYNNVTLDDIQNSAYAPYLKYSRKDGKVFSIYYLYYKTDTMTPYKYKINLDNNEQYDGFSPDPLEPNNWIFAILNQPGTSTPISPDYTTTYWDEETQQYVTNNYGSDRTGVALMKIANYEISELGLVSSLSWKNQIVLYTGVNKINIQKYLTQDPRYASYNNWKTAWEHMLQGYPAWTTPADASVWGIHQYLFGRNEYYSGLDANHSYEPKYPYMKIESESDVIISSNSYLVISGKMGLNDCEFENSQKDDWAGSDRFGWPQEFQLIDQECKNTYIAWTDTWKQTNNRKYFGFPFLEVQIRIGNKICCENLYTDYSDPNNPIRKKQYKWVNVTDYDMSTDGNYSLIIPVGTDKFSFYKLYDITNTCDWRLGLDGASGFAIPLPKEAGLSGKMIIYIIGPHNSIYESYLDGYSDFTSLPTTKTTITVNPNPNNIWNTSTTWNDLNITWNYDGTYPNCILIQDLKFDIKPVQFYTLTDTTKSNSNNKQTDHVYQNIINSQSVVNDKKSIECKINTQDEAKNRSFSSLMKYDNTSYEFLYIEKMWNGEYDNMNNPVMQIQEDNIIELYKNHYESPKIIFDVDIQGAQWTPVSSFMHQFGNVTHLFMINKQEKDLHAGASQIQLIEL